MKRAAIYARVSSQRQKEDETIESQLDALHVYAKKEGYRIPESWVFFDEGVSGESLQRPFLDELRDMIRQEAVETVLIYAPDRLSRKYSHQLILLEEFRKNGVKVCFLKDVPVDNTSEGIMFKHFQGIFAEFEKELKNLQALKLENEKSVDLKQSFEHALERMKTCANDLSLKEKQKIVRLFVEQIVVGLNEVKITHCIPPQFIDSKNCQLSGDGGTKPTVTEGNCGYATRYLGAL